MPNTTELNVTSLRNVLWIGALATGCLNNTGKDACQADADCITGDHCVSNQCVLVGGAGGGTASGPGTLDGGPLAFAVNQSGVIRQVPFDSDGGVDPGYVDILLTEDIGTIFCQGESRGRQVDILVTRPINHGTITPGTYIISSQRPDEGPAVIYYQFPSTGGQSTDLRVAALGGTIVLTSVTAERVQGSFSVTMQHGGGTDMSPLNGTFDAPFVPCP
jgi:hypothetical protein